MWCKCKYFTQNRFAEWRIGLMAADAIGYRFRQSVRNIRLRAVEHSAVFSMVMMVFTITLGTAGNAPAQANKNVQRAKDLTSLSLDELMNVQVTSVSKHEQRLMDAPTAIYVITPEEIRRSGSTSVAELLRMVPGIQVAKISANKWAITSRGYNSEFSNKLLVLIDGRSVYTPLFGGVYWDVQDLILEDIERIEVMRGPGASLWGANAVNGVINIITKRASDTQGGMITAGAGNQERGFGSVRYGGAIGDAAHYRVYAKYFNHDLSVDETGKDAADGWDILRGGFRLDWNVSKVDSLTVQGDIYGGDIGQRLKQTLPVPPYSQSFDEHIKTDGGNVLARWSRVLSPTSSMNLQFYYDRTNRVERLLSEDRDTWDFDFQHSLAVSRNEIVWGMGLRTTRDDLSRSFTVAVDPSSRTTNLLNLFIQDEITLVKNRLRLSVGSKLERNAYTGFESQPSVRLIWTPRKEHSIWTAVSRANRTPSRVERDMRVNVAVIPDMSGLITYYSLFGNREFRSEQLNAYEFGYRFHPTDSLFLRVSTFYNDYNDLSRTLVGAPFFETAPQPAHLVIPLQLDNGGESQTRGIEVAGDWAVTRLWKLSGAYTWFDRTAQGNASLGALGPLFTAGDSPRNQFNIRSLLNLSSKFDCDAAVYYVGRLPSLAVPRYLRTDIGLGWRVSESFEVSLTGQNLFDKRHLEFGGSLFDFGSDRVAVERSVLAKLTWRF
jgi:iron complex outermembrane recepter protein